MTVGAGRPADPGLPAAGGKQAWPQGFYRNYPDSGVYRRLAAIFQVSNHPLGPPEGLRKSGEQVSVLTLQPPRFPGCIFGSDLNPLIYLYLFTLSNFYHMVCPMEYIYKIGKRGQVPAFGVIYSKEEQYFGISSLLHQQSIHRMPHEDLDSPAGRLYYVLCQSGRPASAVEEESLPGLIQTCPPPAGPPGRSPHPPQQLKIKNSTQFPAQLHQMAARRKT